MNKSSIKFIQYWIPVVIWLAIMCWMSTETFSSEQSSRFFIPLINFLFPWLSHEGVDWMHWAFRKAGHFTVYFILGLLLIRAFCEASLYNLKTRWTMCSLIVLVLFAMIDEFHQSLIPARTYLLSDIVIDLAGGMMALLAISVSLRIGRYNKEN